jgi:hypothetical protein
MRNRIDHFIDRHPILADWIASIPWLVVLAVILWRGLNP